VWAASWRSGRWSSTGSGTKQASASMFPCPPLCYNTPTGRWYQSASTSRGPGKLYQGVCDGQTRYCFRCPGRLLRLLVCHGVPC
jgi:hypothetical protein